MRFEGFTVFDKADEASQVVMDRKVGFAVELKKGCGRVFRPVTDSKDTQGGVGRRNRADLVIPLIKEAGVICR